MSEMTAERAGVGENGEGSIPAAEPAAAMAGGEGSGAPSARDGRREPWIETREGGWFFVNALLVSPALVVLFPLTVGLLVDVLAPGREPSPFLDTIPFVASKAVPILGWLLAIPIWATVKALGMKQPPMARIALGFFLLVHLSFLGYAVRAWVGW
jgi:hypothetical protein